MSRKERFAFIILSAIAAALWILLGWSYLTDSWLAPLGPVLDKSSLITTSTPTHSSSPAVRATSTNPVTTSVSSELPTTSPIEPLNNQTPFCNGPVSMNILAIGSDTRAQNYLYGLADVIRYIRVDFVTPGINVLEFPGDLWVEIPGISDHYGITHGKLNQAYFYGNPVRGYYDGLGSGPGLLAQTLSSNYGAHIDHYLAVNMHTFVNLVNAVGGIDIFLPFSVDARKTDQSHRSDLFFAPGDHHLSGEQALMLGRIREYSVFARADQQNRIMCSLKEKLLSPRVIPKIPEIIQTFSGAIQTDLSPQQISQLVCLMPQIKSGDITFTTFPRELLTETRTYDIGVKKDVYIFKADNNTLRLFVQQFDQGKWPVRNQTTSPTEPVRPRGEGTFSCP